MPPARAAGSLQRLLARAADEPVTPARVQELVRDALGDPGLTLALWSPGRAAYLDVDGAPYSLPAETAGRSVTPVLRADERVAVLVHDPALEERTDVVEGFAATAVLLLEQAQLVEELRASRRRLVEAAERERLGLERELHDGAQQRLLTLQITVARARDEARAGPLAAGLAAIDAHAAAAVEDLRALGQEIYPAVLRERGLADGLRSFAGAAPRPVRVVDEGVGRCAATIEAAVYFCAVEAIENAIKHAGSRARVTVTLRHRGSDVEFAVSDDGAGFEADERPPGSGVINMHDRIGGVDGVLEIVSAPGRGTIVRGTVPARTA
jgi:signal transduction histidine kinase